jgi:hypothetical protein
MADISSKKDSESNRTPLERKQSDLKYGGYDWQNVLWMSVSDMNFCYMFVTVKHTWMKWGKEPHRWHRHKYIVLIGSEVNIAGCIAMGEYLHKAVEDFCLAWLGGNGRMLKSKEAASWKTGCARRLRERILERVDSQRRADNTSTALVLYKENEMDLNAKFIKEGLGLSLVSKKSSGRKNLISDAYYQGYETGDKMGIDRPLQ